MCSQNPNRQCNVNFNSKYLAGDILKAKCGASIFIEITDLHTGGVINDPEVTDNYYVEVCKDLPGTDRWNLPPARSNVHDMR